MMRPLAANVVWVLTLTWAGRVYRFATQDLEIDGLPYEGVLTVNSYEESAALLSADEPAPSANVTVFMPVNIATQKGWLRSATAELSQYVYGQALSVRLRGVVRNPDYGTMNEPVTFEIEADGAVDRAVWPPATAKVSESTHAGKMSQGTPYPYVFGKPAHAPGVVLSETGPKDLLVAAGHMPAGSVKVVKVDELGAETTSTEALVHGANDLGEPVTYCSVGGLHSYAGVYVDWSGSNGGLIPDGGMGDCVEFLLDKSTVAWNRAAWGSAKDELNAYRVDFYIDTEGSPWGVARSALLALAPVSLKSTPGGVAPILWDIGATQATAHIASEENAYRVGGLVEDDDHLTNSFRATYKVGYNGTAQLTATATRATVHGLAVSVDNFGEVEAESLDLRVVDSPATAGRSLSWRAAAYPFPWRTLTYATSDDALGSREPGDVVTVTDSDFGLSSAYAHVVGMNWADGVALVTVTIIHRP